jgi:uncharacterized protein (DUF2141 family)
MAAGCANIVTPEGGPRDLAPPVVLESDPPDRSLNFRGREVRITFNEFPELKDLASQLFVSPPLGETPDVHLRGKSMYIRLPDSLAENTTYTLYFGNAIRDITEANILKDFTYSFSTGPTRDSLEMKGRVEDAFTREPVADVLVCLYRGREDSLFTTRPPDYITRSREDGSFSVYNLPADSFRVYALKDANGNAYFDLPNEAIAFDTLQFVPDPPRPATDTSSFVDTLSRDSLSRDSLNILPINKDTVDGGSSDSLMVWMPSERPLLRLFNDQDTTQRLLKAWVPDKSHIRLEFSQMVEDLRIIPLDTVVNEVWFLREFNDTRDSIDLWMIRGMGDSLRLLVEEGDRLMDTVELSLEERQVARKPARGSASPAKIAAPLPLLSPARNIFPSEKIGLVLPFPVDTIFNNRFLLSGGGDTTLVNFVRDTASLRRLILKHTLRAGTEYILSCGDSAILDIRGLYTDSTGFRIRTLTSDDAGSLTLELNGMPDPVWTVELLGPKKEVVRRLREQMNGSVVFSTLIPGMYRIRIYEDSNRNRRWDSGHYNSSTQPERVEYFPSELNVRAKWELKEKFEAGKK